MIYPNAHNGVKKIFTSEIFSIIAAVCLIIGAIFLVIAAGAASEGSAAGTAGFGIPGLVFLFAAVVLDILCIIFLLIGLKRAGHDEDSFNSGFVFAIIMLVVTVIGGCLTTVADGMISNIATVVSSLLGIFVIFSVTQGVSNLATALGREDLVNQGKTVNTLYLVFIILSMIANLISVFIKSDNIWSGILALIAAIVSLVAYIIYLVFLGKARNMLENAKDDVAPVEEVTAE